MDNITSAAPITTDSGQPSALHKGLHMAGASPIHDAPAKWIAALDAILVIAIGGIIIYTDIQWSYINGRTIDDVLFAYFCIALVPWVYLGWIYFDMTGVAIRRKRVVVDSMEVALGIDIDRNEHIGPKPEIPTTWFTVYVSRILFDNYPTTRDAARKLSIGYDHWKVAKKLLIDSGLCIVINKQSFGKRSGVTINELNDFLYINHTPVIPKPKKLKKEKAIMSNKALEKIVIFIFVLLASFGMASQVQAAPEIPDNLSRSVKSQPHEWQTKQAVQTIISRGSITRRITAARRAKAWTAVGKYRTALAHYDAGQFKAASRQIRSGNWYLSRRR